MRKILTLLCILSKLCYCMLIHRTWTDQKWCKLVENPVWPYAYQKKKDQIIEKKGRYNSNLQDMRHECTIFGVQSKCHICKEIQCGTALDQKCQYQLQGISWSNLPKNIPTTTDIPWSVNGKHRYDYIGGSHICLFLTGGHCLSPFELDYSDCKIRCWGKNSGKIQYYNNSENYKVNLMNNSNQMDVWSYPKSIDPSVTASSQGWVRTLAGTGEKGYKDGPANIAMFNNPRDIAIDSKRNIYVADTNNHLIRKISYLDQTVSTIAGTGKEGFQDGNVLEASFSYPSGICVYEDTNNNIILYVSDTGNHRIRKIFQNTVTCFSGRCGQGSETETLFKDLATPHAGLADGAGAIARFSSPLGIAVDSNGIVFVADTGNHLIRKLSLDGTTITLAGNVQKVDEEPGCPSPCMKGVSGSRDGNLTYAQFLNPSDVSIGPSNTVLVTDNHRIRRITYGGGAQSIIQGILSSDRVVTIAGDADGSNVLQDGLGNESKFNHPYSITMTKNGRMYTSSTIDCTIRSLAPTNLVVKSIICSEKLADVFVPSGCSSYNEPVDSLNNKKTSVSSYIQYNHIRELNGKNVIYDKQDIGRELKPCVGIPPPPVLVTGDLSLPLMDNSTGIKVLNISESSEDKTILKVYCSPHCLMNNDGSEVFGTNMYSDRSSICKAAIHAGIIKDDNGRQIEIVIENNLLANNQMYASGSLQNGIQSKEIDADMYLRIFSVHSYSTSATEVQTIAGGGPAAPLENPCGYKDNQIPLLNLFNGPSGISVYQQLDELSDTDYLFIADSNNNRIRYLSATCSRVCENGGKCVKMDSCDCADGWEGTDCTVPICTNRCGNRMVCVAPDECSCIPGYIGSNCDIATCSNTCENNGICSAPDTCRCSPGWFDPNCTTPVCTQTCGNGGNCTSPDTCTCETDKWKGNDCRIPVCSQNCLNGGSCTAPNTCLCTAGWSGFDCSIPICTQGYFIPHPSPYKYSLDRPQLWKSYKPCDYLKWCNATGGFDCLQERRNPKLINQISLLDLGLNYSNCSVIEIGEDALTNFIYFNERNNTSNYFRYSPFLPYGFNATGYPWRAIISETEGYYLPPWDYKIDRQIALVELLSIVQGVYACANGGNCVRPDVCECATGWIGFDCRTPVCEQGYYVPDQLTFLEIDPSVSLEKDNQPSNPPYNRQVEALSYSSVTYATDIEGNERYLSISPSDIQYQGGYSCSIRSLTKWEKPLTIGPNGSKAFSFEHPNYYSRYMDTTVSPDGIRYTLWENMSWPPLYEKSKPLLDNTKYGWQRGGVWNVIPGSKWQKGKCFVEFQRLCPDSPRKAYDLVSNSTNISVRDTDVSYRSRSISNYIKETSLGRWAVRGGECVDTVLRGCYNNGTCVAPNTCKCATGWTGHDCSIPLCKQTCLHNGNCTLPNICTCEKGWMGVDCSIPLCSQECRNGGKCIAPDTCNCTRRPSTWRDGREFNGRPIFRQKNGDPQLTGYTGYDCSTPICTQAEKFILNVPSRTDLNFKSLGGYLEIGKESCDLERCPLYDQEIVSNDGYSFQAGCKIVRPFNRNKITLSTKEQIYNLQYGNDSLLNIDRTSDELCGNIVWEQGDYIDGNGRSIRVNYQNFTKIKSSNNNEDNVWIEGVALPGEGVYMCYNKGSCIKPDVCTCGDGYSGFDCNTPLCRFVEKDTGKIVGCQHNSVCTSKDTCTCIQTESILHKKYSNAPTGMTGYSGSDCSIAVCVQGFFDPLCNNTISGKDGCYRCPNGGLCVSPDLCQCAPGWSGYDCKTPVCYVKATEKIREQLFTVDEKKIQEFENDPCGSNGGRWGKEEFNDVYMGQGNCTLPGLCTCLCKDLYDKNICKNDGESCNKPWTDPWKRTLPPGYVYGTKGCADGFQGLENKDGKFISCHLKIYKPSFYRKYTASFIAILTIFTLVFLIGYWQFRKRMKRKYLLLKVERRRSKRNSEEDPLNQKPGAFEYK